MKAVPCTRSSKRHVFVKAGSLLLALSILGIARAESGDAQNAKRQVADVSLQPVKFEGTLIRIVDQPKLSNRLRTNKKPVTSRDASIRYANSFRMSDAKSADLELKQAKASMSVASKPANDPIRKPRVTKQPVPAQLPENIKATKQASSEDSTLEPPAIHQKVVWLSDHNDAIIRPAIPVEPSRRNLKRVEEKESLAESFPTLEAQPVLDEAKDRNETRATSKVEELADIDDSTKTNLNVELDTIEIEQPVGSTEVKPLPGDRDTTETPDRPADPIDESSWVVEVVGPVVDMPEIVALEPELALDLEELEHHGVHDPATCPECRAFLLPADSAGAEVGPVQTARFDDSATKGPANRKIAMRTVTDRSANSVGSHHRIAQRGRRMQDHETAPISMQDNVAVHREGLWFEDDAAISSATISIQPRLGAAPGEKLLPQSEAEKRQGDYASGINVGSGIVRSWGAAHYAWEAPSMYHRPLYFEQVNLERYGHFRKHWQVQSALSTAHFFATIPALPLEMWIDPPCERVYTLGHHRPGDCNPHQNHWRP